MPTQTLDTNLLITHFNRHRPLGLAWVSGMRRGGLVELIDDQETTAILSPVEVEFLCGVVDEQEMRLREAFLRPFEVVDGHRTLPED